MVTQGQWSSTLWTVPSIGVRIDRRLMAPDSRWRLGIQGELPSSDVFVQALRFTLTTHELADQLVRDNESPSLVVIFCSRRERVAGGGGPTRFVPGRAKVID